MTLFEVVATDDLAGVAAERFHGLAASSRRAAESSGCASRSKESGEAR
jgi:hypothetical protein